MKHILLSTSLLLFFFNVLSQDLVITGIFDGNLSGGTPKAIELYVINDIADLSTYGFSNASNGNGVSQVEFQFSGAAPAGTYLYISKNEEEFSGFFGFEADFITASANNNGDDAIAIYSNVAEDSSGSLQGDQIDGYGLLDVDGTDQVWDYQDGWAYRINGTGPDGDIFNPTQWIISGINENDDDLTQATATNPWPLGTYSTGPPECSLVLTSISTTCSATTPEIDGVTISVPFTGGGTMMFTTTLSSGSGTLEGDDPSTTSEGVLLITSVPENTTITLEITSIACSIIETVTAPACLPPVDVSTVASLRAGSIGQSYRLTSEALITFEQSFRNQKFIEDASGALLIDDVAGSITSPYSIGDGIVNLTGTLADLDGMLTLIPSLDPGEAFTTGNAVTATTVTVAALITNPTDYEATLIELKEVLINTSQSTTWLPATQYTLTTSGGAYVFKTSFEEVDYINTEIPTALRDITGIITRGVDGDYYLTARSLSDFADSLSIADQEKTNTLLYPNPATSVITFTRISEGSTVSIYNTNAKLLLQEKNIRFMDISTLSAGVYVIKITDGRKTQNSKLIIK